MCKEFDNDQPTRDYSLLRPFDLEAAKRGDEVCYKWSADPVGYITHFSETDSLIENNSNQRSIVYHSQLRMKPLCWVEGEPVYKGDVLYSRVISATEHIVEYSKEISCGALLYNSSDRGIRTDYLTWQKPKQKREGWVNVYSDRSCSNFAHKSQEEANSNVGAIRAACVRIEWEE